MSKFQASRVITLSVAPATAPKHLMAALLETLRAALAQNQVKIDLNSSYMEMYLSEAEACRLPLEDLRAARAPYEGDVAALEATAHGRVAQALAKAKARIAHLENQVPSDELGDPDEVAAVCDAMTEVAALQSPIGTPDEVTAVCEAMTHVGRVLLWEHNLRRDVQRVAELRALECSLKLPALRAERARLQAEVKRAQRASR